MRRLLTILGTSVMALLFFGSLALPAGAVAGGCPSYNGIVSAAINLPVTNPSYPLSVSYSQSGHLFHYSITTPSSPTNFGVIEICVYPTTGTGGSPTGTIPGSTTQSTSVSNWGAGQDGTKGYVFAGRATGSATLAYGTGTTDALDVTWGTVPSGFLIVLHILDGTICGPATSGGNPATNPGTCFVIPNGTPLFPPPPPPSIPQFPVGGLVLLIGAVLPALLLLRRRSLKGI